MGALDRRVLQAMRNLISDALKNTPGSTMRSLDSFNPAAVNQTTAFQSAMAWAGARRGSVLFFPNRPGGYLIEPEQVNLVSGLTITCEPGTVIRYNYPTDSEGNLLAIPQAGTYLLTADRRENLQIGNLGFTSNHFRARGLLVIRSQIVKIEDISAQTAPVIRVQDSHHVQISRVTMQGNRSLYTMEQDDTFAAIQIPICQDVTLKEVIGDGYGHGIQWYGGDAANTPGQGGVFAGEAVDRQVKKLTIQHCHMSNMTHGGIWGSMGEDVAVENSTAVKCGDVGFDAEGCRRTTFELCYASDCKNGNFATFYRNYGIKFIDCTSELTNAGTGNHLSLYGDADVIDGSDDLTVHNFTAWTKSVSAGLDVLGPANGTYRRVFLTGKTNLINVAMVWNNVPAYTQSYEDVTVRVTDRFADEQGRLNLMQVGSCVPWKGLAPRLHIGKVDIITVPQHEPPIGLIVRILNQETAPAEVTIGSIDTEGTGIPLIIKNEVRTTQESKRTRITVERGRITGDVLIEGDNVPGFLPSITRFRDLHAPGGKLSGNQLDFTESRQNTAVTTRLSGEDIGSGFFNISDASQVEGLWPGASGLILFVRTKHPNPNNDVAAFLAFQLGSGQVMFGERIGGSNGINWQPMIPKPERIDSGDLRTMNLKQGGYVVEGNVAGIPEAGRRWLMQVIHDVGGLVWSAIAIREDNPAEVYFGGRRGDGLWLDWHSPSGAGRLFKGQTQTIAQAVALGLPAGESEMIIRAVDDGAWLLKDGTRTEVLITADATNSQSAGPPPGALPVGLWGSSVATLADLEALQVPVGRFLLVEVAGDEVIYKKTATGYKPLIQGG